MAFTQYQNLTKTITLWNKINTYSVTGQKPIEEKENFPTCKICKVEFLHQDTLKIHNKLRPNCLEPKNSPKPSRKRQSMERIGLSVTKEKVKSRKRRSYDEDSDESSESDSGMFYNHVSRKKSLKIVMVSKSLKVFSCLQFLQKTKEKNTQSLL